MASAVLLLAGCGGSTGDSARLPDSASPNVSSPGPAGDSAPPARPSGEDAVALVDQALAARDGNDPAEFAALLSAASLACPDPDAGRRLAEVAAIASRWSSALLDGRPKAQKVTEEQLAAVGWSELAAPCAAVKEP